MYVYYKKVCSCCSFTGTIKPVQTADRVGGQLEVKLAT